MASDTPVYQKLPGRGVRHKPWYALCFLAPIILLGITRCRLWLGLDHLLAVDCTISSEEYRRFYFRDIEAVIIRRTAARQVWNWVLIALILLTAGPFVLAWRSEGSGGLLITAMIIAAFWGIFLLVNSLRGATCKTHIRTAVQIEELPSLGRLPVARKVLARLQPLIVAAQGAATSEELAAAPWMAGGAAGAAPGSPYYGKPLRAEKGYVHGGLFALLIVEAVLSAVAWIFFNNPLSVFSMVAMLAGCIVCIIAFMRQGNTDLPGSVITMTKATLGFYILKCVGAFVFMIVFSTRHPGTPVVSGLEIVGEPGFAEASLVFAALELIIGVLGFIFLLGHFRRPAPQPAV